MKTLFAANAAIALFMAFALLFYRIHYKTYPGYGLWLSSAFAVAFAYLSLMVREWIPEWVGILLTNIIILSTMLLRLGGVVRFVSEEKLPRIYFLLPLLCIPVVLFGYFDPKDLAYHNLCVSSSVLFFCGIIAWKLLQGSTELNRQLYRAGAILFAVYGLMMWLRGFVWAWQPEDSLFNAGTSHQIYFLFLTVFEVGIGLFFVMMNNQRLETEWLDMQDDLHRSVYDLETAISEIKTLKGVIPICMHCKEIRDADGNWNKLEHFISANSDARFTHGICDQCMEEHYSEFPES